MTDRQKAYENMVYAAAVAVDELWVVERQLHDRPELAAQIRRIYTALRDAQNTSDKLWGF